MKSSIHFVEEKKSTSRGGRNRRTAYSPPGPKFSASQDKLNLSIYAKNPTDRGLCIHNMSPQKSHPPDDVEVGYNVTLVIPDEARACPGRNLHHIHAEGIAEIDERADVHYPRGGLWPKNKQITSKIAYW